MRIHLLFAFTIIASLLTGGCSATTTSAGTRSRTVTPAGPVSTGTSDPGLIPARTEIVIRTNEAIEATAPAAGKLYTAQTARDIVDSRGRVLVPSGSPVELVVVDSSRGGTGRTPSLNLAIASMTVNGNRYAVNSDTQTETGSEGLGRNERTAKMVGGGALLGTLIGAVAGGGKGAAIGAAVGAAGGAAVQVLTQGKEVKIPAETVMTFRLDSPIRLQGFSR